jgi:hypothetical protein
VRTARLALERRGEQARSAATRATLMRVAKYAGIGTGVSLGLFGAKHALADEAPQGRQFDDAEKERKYREWKSKRKAEETDAEKADRLKAEKETKYREWKAKRP